jgi:diguanylate cyclase (GGDEF)-like protein
VIAASKLIDFRVARLVVICVALAVLVIVGLVDYITGYQISFSLFYLVPVGFAAWYGSRSTGYAIAVVSSLIWYAAEIAAGYPYGHPAIPVWNALVRLAFFVIVASLLCALQRRLQAEKNLARIDTLTGLMNSRAFREQLDHDLAVSARVGVRLTVAYLDLDDFKRVNDTFGHAGGDALLQTIGEAMTATMRRSDTVARLGGDEFAMILPGTDSTGARSVMSKLVQQLGETSHDRRSAVTFSIGAIVIDAPAASADEVIAAADGLMYIAKNGGKNAIAIGRYSNLALDEVQVYPSGAVVNDAA